MAPVSHSREGLNPVSLLHRCSSGASELSLSMFRPNASDSSLAGVHVYEQILILKVFFSSYSKSWASSAGFRLIPG